MKLVTRVIATLLVLGSIASAQVQFPPHPRLILPDSDLPAIKHRIETHAWAKRAYEDLKQRADDWLEKKLDIPDKGGQWSHYYACKKCGARLRTESPTRHVCPADGAVYTGWPYDEVAIGHRHGEFSVASKDLALAYRITGDKRYAEKSRDILLGYAERYLKYPLHNNKNEPKVGGGRVLSQSLSEAVWLIRMAQATDLIWDTLTPQQIDTLKTQLFYPAAVDVIQKHELKIHNIQCWKNSAVGLVGLLFEDRALVADAIDGTYGLRNQMEQGITADGAWLEGAWGYHLYTMSALLPLAEAARICGIDCYTPRFKSMFTAPIELAMPDGKLPAFNDSGTSTAVGNENYELALARFDDPLLARAIPTTQRSNLSALFYGVDNLPQPKVQAAAESRKFDACGFAILRAGTPDNPTWLCLKYSPHGGGHGHPDKNSFVLYANHSILADDAGTFAYGVALHKEWSKTTIAHNTILMDEEDQKPATGQCLAFTTGKDFSAALLDAGDAIPNCRFHRAAFLLGNDLIVFIDTIRTDDGREHTFDLAYHPQGNWVDPPSGKTIEMPDKPGYKHLRAMTMIDSSAPFSLTTESEKIRSRVTFAPADGARYLIGTGVGKNAQDRVPIVIARQTGASAVFIWAITLGEKKPVSLTPIVHEKGRGQSVAPDALAGARVRDESRGWMLLVDPNADTDARRLHIIPVR